MTEKSGTDEPLDLEHCLDNLEPIASRSLRLIVLAFPWAALLNGFGRLAFMHLKPGLVMYLSTTVAVSLAMLLGSMVLLPLIKEVPRTLWHRNLIAEPPDSTEAPGLQERYSRFILEFTAALNGRGQVIAGLVLGLAGASWVPIAVLRGRQDGTPKHNFPLPTEWAPLEFALALLMGFVAGLLAWRIAIVSLYVFRLGREFELRIQLGHPDGAGGLSPLGNLCFWNALIISVFSIHLGAWLIVAPTLGGEYAHLADSYHVQLMAFTLVPIVFAVLGIVWPLWSVHEEMLVQRNRVTRSLEDISQLMDKLNRDLLNEVEELDVETFDKKTKQIERYTAIYKANQRVPVWPFNMRTVAHFVTVQTIPLLAGTGIGGAALKWIGGLLGFSVAKP